MPQKRTPSDILAWTFGVYILIILSWSLAWIIKVNLDPQSGWLVGSEGSYFYWTIAKIFIWILPAIFLVRLSGRSVGEIYNFKNWRGWLIWGGGIGSLIALINFIYKYWANEPQLPLEPSYELLSVLTVAPIFEEFLIRGALLGNLQQQLSLWTANIISSVMFVGLHVPGWFFMGSLVTNLTSPVGGALTIFLISLAFGYATYRGKSVMGGTLVHFFNNLSSLR